MVHQNEGTTVPTHGNGSHFTLSMAGAKGADSSGVMSTMKTDYIAMQGAERRQPVMTTHTKLHSNVEQGDRAKVCDFVSTQSEAYKPHTNVQRQTYVQEGLRSTHFSMDADHNFEDWRTNNQITYRPMVNPPQRLQSMSLQRSHIPSGDQEKEFTTTSTMKSDFTPKPVVASRSGPRGPGNTAGNLNNNNHGSNSYTAPTTIHQEKTFDSFESTSRSAYVEPAEVKARVAPPRKPDSQFLHSDPGKVKTFDTTSRESYTVPPRDQYAGAPKTKEEVQAALGTSTICLGDGKTPFSHSVSTNRASYLPHIIYAATQSRPDRTQLPQWTSNIPQGDAVRVNENRTSTQLDFQAPPRNVFRAPLPSQEELRTSHFQLGLHNDGDYRTTFKESYYSHGRVARREPSRRAVVDSVPTGDPDKMAEYDTTSGLSFQTPRVTERLQRVGGEELNKLRAHHFNLGREPAHQGSWETTMKSSYDGKAGGQPARAFAPKLQGSSIPQGDREKINDWQTTSRTMCAPTGSAGGAPST